ncbi:Cytochrome c551 peroxidase precursor [Tautonia plasticadhaerens]|uniref:Cytochrome c551 peroxidase n=2 Tax=Tautonia plasticadhaerens TaxID=2527974 RepID=A0A518HD97_9BACT|nr:cytochrome c peroxidase [Tautonia plasticadhaerens]QDV38829.1 Cytochrome c551 peroxidase precursor [Tautonia plasticadhaerens]
MTHHMTSVLLPATALSLAMILAPAATGRADDGASAAVTLGDPSLTAGIPGEGPLSTDEIEAWLADEENHEVLDVLLPLGLSAGQGQIVGTFENPMTRAKIELGRQLYFDPRLSADRTISCATCHAPEFGFASDTRVGVGIRDQEGARNSPTASNRILSGPQFWDGRAASLEEQAVGPIANPIEMGNTHDVAADTIRKIPVYALQFGRIYPEDGVTIDTIGEALATFERAIVTGPSPYDYAEELAKFDRLDPAELEDLKEFEPGLYEQYQTLQAGAEVNPMSEEAKLGRELFFSQRVNCSACHVGPNLADELFHNLGVGMDGEEPDVGRFAVTGDPEDWGAFKTPTIRNVSQTAPYMHDGSLGTLEEVVEHYARGGIPNENLSDKIAKIDLTPEEKRALVAFMEACTGPLPEVESGRLPE